jgi:hypothetical protein
MDNVWKTEALPDYHQYDLGSRLTTKSVWIDGCDLPITENRLLSQTALWALAYVF